MLKVACFTLLLLLCGCIPKEKVNITFEIDEAKAEQVFIYFCTEFRRVGFVINSKKFDEGKTTRCWKSDDLYSMMDYLKPKLAGIHVEFRYLRNENIIRLTFYEVDQTEFTAKGKKVLAEVKRIVDSKVSDYTID